MIIGITGTHCSGKTSLAQSLHDILKNQHRDVILITEVARRCPYPLNTNSTLLTQLWIIGRQIYEEELLQHHNYVIQDRILLDALYYTYDIDSELSDMLFSHFVREYIENRFDFVVWKRYNETFLDASSSEDGVRSTDKAYAKRIDEISEMYMKQCDLNIIDEDDMKEILLQRGAV